VEPTLYPDKLQPLLYALSLADHVVLIADSLNQYVGEMIVALGLMGKESGIVLSTIELPAKGTILEKYGKAQTQEEAREWVHSLQNPPSGGEMVSLVDSAFQVKSVGNVALGAVRSGSIKKRDRLLHLPSKSELEIRSIQLNDKDVEEASAGGRFGISYKGGPIDRGILASPSNSFSISTSFLGTLYKSPFYRAELPRKIHAYSNFQFIEGKASDSSLELEKPIAARGGEPLLIVYASNPKLRICGAFTPAKS
jgi:selenocysteine-specific translation elongation factor